MNVRFLLIIASVLICIGGARQSNGEDITFEDIQEGSTSYSVDLDQDGTVDLIFKTYSPQGFTVSAPPVSLDGISDPGLGGKVLSQPSEATPFETAEVMVEFLGGASGSLAFNFAVSGGINTPWNAYVQVGTHEDGLISGDFVAANSTVSEMLPSRQTVTVSEGLMKLDFARTVDFALINFNTTSGGLFILDNFAGTFGTVMEPILEPAISISPSSLDFGNVQVGNVSAPIEVFVSSSGEADLVIEDLFITGQDAIDFSIESDLCSRQTLPPGETAEVAISFSPTSDGVKNATLSIPTNVSVTPPIDVSLTGTGQAGPVWIDSIQITGARQEPRATYGRLDPVFITMNYTLAKELKRRYRIVAKVLAFGEISKEVRKKASAGRYTFTTSFLPGDAAFGGNPIVSKLKVIRKGKVVGKDTETRYVIVTE